jgi:hypothetical protein
VSDHTAYYHNRGSMSAVSQLAALMEPVVIFTLSMTCLFYGVKLQVHVLSTGVSTGVQRKLLVQLNIVLCLIVLCYLARAVMLLRLFGPIPQWYKDAIDPGYLCWLLGTRWLCHIVCSLFLIRVMSKNSSNIAPGGAGGSSVYNTPLKVKDASGRDNKDVFLRHVLDGPGNADGGLDDSDMDLSSVMSVLQEDYRRQSGTSGGGSISSGSISGRADEPLLYPHGYSQQSHGQSQGTGSGQSSSFTQYVNQLLSTWRFGGGSGGAALGGDDKEDYAERLLARQHERQERGDLCGSGQRDRVRVQGGGGMRASDSEQSLGAHTSVEVGSPSTLSYLSQVSSLMPPVGTSPGRGAVSHSPGDSGNVFDPRKYQSDRYVSVDSTVSN